MLVLRFVMTSFTSFTVVNDTIDTKESLPRHTNPVDYLHLDTKDDLSTTNEVGFEQKRDEKERKVGAAASKLTTKNTLFTNSPSFFQLYSPNKVLIVSS